jgi:hypothetical protein
MGFSPRFGSKLTLRCFSLRDKLDLEGSSHPLMRESSAPLKVSPSGRTTG